MGLLYRLKVHLTNIGLDKDCDAAIDCFLKSRKDPAKTINRILLMDKEQVLNQIVISGIIKLLGQQVVDNLRNGEYLLIDGKSTEELQLDMVVWSDASILTSAVCDVTPIERAISEFIANNSVGMNWISSAIEVPTQAEFRVKNFNLSELLIKLLFTELDKGLAGIAAFKDLTPTNIYYCELKFK